MQEEIHDLYGAVDVEAMYQAAIRQPLDRKVEQAIALLQMHEATALRLSPTGYYGCDSGGKDSEIPRKLMQLAGVKHTNNYSNVTVDPPEVVYHLKKHHPDTIWHSQGISLPQYMVKHGKLPPTRMCRWCCEVFKEQGGNGSFKVIGVRAEESKRRKGLWTPVRIDSRTKLPVLSPILYWTEDDVWEFIKHYEIPYCELYDERGPDGKRVFPRLGCVGCPLGARRNIEFERWPRYAMIWKNALTATWLKWKDVPTVRTYLTTCETCGGGDDVADGTCPDCGGTGTIESNERRFWKRFKSGDELWEWWLNNKANGKQTDCQLWLW